MLSLKIQFFTLLASLICAFIVIGLVDCQAEPLNEQTNNIDAALHQLELSFIDSSKRFFWEQQKLADGLIAKKHANAYGLKKISSTFTRFQCIWYAIGRKTLEITKQILEKQFGPEKGSVRNELILKSEHSELLELRASFRGMLDTLNDTETLWIILRSLIEHYAGANTTPELRKLAGDVYLARQELGESISAVYDEIEKRLEENGFDEKEALEMTGHLDKIIDDAMKCPQCVSLPDLDESYFSAHSMFESEADITKLVEEKVSRNLLDAIEKSDKSTSGHVLELTPEEIEKLDLSDVDESQEEFLEKEGLLHAESS